MVKLNDPWFQISTSRIEAWEAAQERIAYIRLRERMHNQMARLDTEIRRELERVDRPKRRRRNRRKRR